ncbi:hypothetical protein BASA81_015141 [Batrachochytrium salamandrivorans]|nr:hypothetical protein BASA81_015141 [Batrachochytrium salamandrivorans]
MKFEVLRVFCDSASSWSTVNSNQSEDSLHTMSLSKNSRILQLLNYRLKITIQDGRTFIGQMMAFDKHMNLVLSECEEFRKIRPKTKGQQEREEKRSLGLVILRGETIVSLSVEAPPPTSEDSKRTAAAALGGPGVARGAGRGLPISAPLVAAPAGLGGPVRGIGGPGPQSMQPQMGPGGSSMAFGRPPMPGMPPGMPGMPPGMPGMGMPGAPPMPFGRGMPPMPPQGFRPPPGMPMPPPGFRPPFPGAPPGFHAPPPGFRPPPSQ